MTAALNLIFAGTPEFAARAMAALLASRHRVVLALTQPDRPAGRAMKASSSPVKQIAQANGIPVLQPATLKDTQVQNRLRESGADLMVVAAYGLILPQAVLDIPRLGALNIHASLLPRWRGAAPIARAVLAGDRETGISIMKMDAGLDTGPVLLQRAIPIRDEDDAASLEARLADLGAGLIVEALDLFEKGMLSPDPQPAQGVTYAAKLEKGEARLAWGRPATELWRSIRAFNPFPGAQTSCAGEEIKIWRAALADARGAPGEIIAVGNHGILVACGEGGIRLLELQRAGAKRLAAAEFLRGRRLRPGERFGD
ncbi:MAG: methionyl-tRNA formyltransferase [Betaproteobacteria bacterium]|nr:methionyl-tRNA formyltransferase [Betaproteobacteria bacterium]